MMTSGFFRTVSGRFGALMALVLAFPLIASAQVDRHDVRKGNREFRREDYRAADVDYGKALLRDSTSFAANFNLANTLYRLAGGQEAQGGLEEMNKYYKAAQAGAEGSEYEADYWFNMGDAALAAKD